MTCALLVIVGIGLQPADPAVAAPPGVDAAAASAQIEGMSASLATTMKSYAVAADDLASTRAAIAANTAMAVKLDGSIADGRDRLAAEARFLYLNGGIGFAEILLGSSSLEEFVNRSFALQRVTARDAQLVERLASERAQRLVLRTALVTRERRQATLVAALAQNRVNALRSLDAQQRYVDSLSTETAAALDAHLATSNRSKAVKPKPAAAGSVVSAKVTGRGGSYAVLGGQPTRYQPTGVTFDGVATWYGNVRAGMGTASGVPFDENQLTCAHKTLPFGTRVAVTFRGKSVIVTVTDRGPYGKGRVIDLSKRAASLIGLKSAGVGAVHCEVVRPVR